MSTIEQPPKVSERRSHALGTPDRRRLSDLERFRERAQTRRRESEQSPEEGTPPETRPAA